MDTYMNLDTVNVSLIQGSSQDVVVILNRAPRITKLDINMNNTAHQSNLPMANPSPPPPPPPQQQHNLKALSIRNYNPICVGDVENVIQLASNLDYISFSGSSNNWMDANTNLPSETRALFFQKLLNTNLFSLELNYISQIEIPGIMKDYLRRDMPEVVCFTITTSAFNIKLQNSSFEGNMNQQQMTNTMNQLYDYEAIKRITLNLLHCHHSRVIETISIITNNDSNTQKLSVYHKLHGIKTGGH